MPIAAVSNPSPPLKSMVNVTPLGMLILTIFGHFLTPMRSGFRHVQAKYTVQLVDDIWIKLSIEHAHKGTLKSADNANLHDLYPKLNGST